MDALSLVADEVALEGLDGITIPSLWIRLESRLPPFPLKLDDCTKGFLWKSLASNSDLSFYQLPEQRDDVVLFDRFKDIDPETGIEIRQKFSDSPKDIYPVHIIQENKDGIQGSCALFKERKDVTKQVRSKTLTPLVSLEEALEIYGRKLVVVASQTLRFRTLIGAESDPDLKLSDDSYCVLERVGRARWQGELQRDLHGSAFKIDARKCHYLRKSLVRHELVTMQSHVTRLEASGQQQHSILLLLKRFHVNRRSKYDILMEYVSNFLQQLPGQFATLVSLKEQLNVNERTLRRILKYMRSAKLVEYCQFPLEDLDPSAGPCTKKNGSKVLVRCLRLVKPYTRKGITEEEEDDDDDDEEYDAGARSVSPSEGRLMERDAMSQAYHIVLASGTNGIPKSGISFRMNVGKLESRMLCRKLERDGVIKGFMVDEGRQRTTKYISHKCVGVSGQLKQFAKEQERKKLLYSSAPHTPNTELTKTPSGSEATGKEDVKLSATKKVKKTNGEGGKERAVETTLCDDRKEDEGNGDKERVKAEATRKAEEEKGVTTANETQPDIPIIQPSTEECEAEEQPKSTCAGSLPQNEALNEGDDPTSDDPGVIKSVSELKAPKGTLMRTHETYRLLRRKNLIVEAIRNLKIIEGLFPLQKMINDEEKQDGVSSKCCKKSIVRLVNSLSREGLLKIYTTTVIQDGITRKVEMIVHPSIQPNDDLIKDVIEQIRFKISSSYSAVRLQHVQEKAKDQEKESEQSKSSNGSMKDDPDFKPTTVRGLSKTFGFQPKMHRLRVVHNFLWYVIYGHPLQNADSNSTSQTTADPSGSDSDSHVKPNTKEPGKNTDARGQTGKTADDAVPNLDDVTSGEEGEEPKDKSVSSNLQSDMKVYVDEDSWKKFIPPVRVHKDFTRGWAMVGDLLLCLPLSVFVQVIQVNYKVDGLEEYLNDPVKQHYLVRALPASMKRQLLYKRKYIFVFHENLQRLIYMGLLQFGPAEKFKEKDQVFVYLRRNATIVDTTSAEPHYWLVTESPDKPFERRQYTFNTADDVESYWFDLMCVCLNTPLGVIRNKRSSTEEETAPPFVRERSVFVGMAHLLKGSLEVCDNGLIPGDGKGAGGLDSEFFAHLKRNWLWTNHLLAVKKNPSGLEAEDTKIRLKSLLSKNALRIALKAGESTSPRYLTAKRPLIIENVEVDIEPASRNQRVVGGKKQKRKRTKKEVVKVSRKKKKEPKKRTPAHDEADHRALKMMTRQRVYWSVQEDSLMMLCCVASHLLNGKLKRPFIPHCVVRDLLHTEFDISIDKTSLSVSRRSRYILKNPQTLLNYRICLAEVYQDKTMMRVLEEKKPADPDKPEDCVKAFSEYVRLLRQKFSSVMSAHEMIIPDTKQELFSRFKVSAIDNEKQVSSKDTLTCTDDIHATVLHNLIQSTLAMTNNQMKSSRSFQTFHMYSQYNQELLCQVFIQCRRRGLINRRRVSQPFGPKKNRALPILPMSYQLSQSYYRCFSWRFPYSLCTDSFCFLKCLLDNGARDDRPVTQIYHETENRLHSAEEALERRPASKRKEKQSGEKEEDGPSSEAAETGDNQSQIGGGGEKSMESDISNMKTEDVSKADEQKSTEDRLASGSSEVEENQEQTDDCPTEEEPVGASATPQAPEGPPDVSEMLQFSLDSPGGACAVSLGLMSLGLLSVYLSVPKQMVVVDSNLVDNDVVKSMAALEEEEDDDYDGEEFEGKKKLQVKAHQASHTNYLMMRGYCSPGIVKLRNLNTNDNIVMESCTMRLQLRNTPAHGIFSVENSVPLDLTRCGPSLLPSILTYSVRSSRSSPPSVEECDGRFIQQRGYSPQDLEACARLRRSLEEAGENGLDVHDLHEAHTDLHEPQSGRTRSLDQYVKDLQEEGQVVRVGSSGVRWVLMQHADPWLLTVNSKQRTQSRSLESKHSLVFMRKRRRSRSLCQDADESPAKKVSVDEEKSADAEEQGGAASSVTGEKPDEEQVEKEKAGEEQVEKEKADEGRGGTAPDVEEERGTQTEPEEKREEESVDIQKRQGQEREQSDNERDEEECSSPSGSADDDENVSFISRPWRMVDGKLNRQVCKGMLEAVLYHIMSRPGITQQTLVEHYKDLLQPVAVLDLVQALIDIGCVTKKVLNKRPKPSLFARCQANQRRANTEEPDTVFYEPTISCCLRLCQALPNERHWNYCVP
ncbi:general transcription factor 3C polypeptide 1-like [Mugil cephalus]|uniref:general transcription factor 3C polypeptide 1-like n=1 Tax=Mugil cephalus TaxID=48193 RepID=UPI001FB77555|nr:general transcription factor 3C polypeptide 1-like [Mugil cephalus]